MMSILIEFGCISFPTSLTAIICSVQHKNLLNNRTQFTILKTSTKNSHSDGLNELEWKIAFASIEHWKLFCWLELFNFWLCVYPEWVCVVNFVSGLKRRWDTCDELESSRLRTKNVKKNCYKIYEKCLRREVGEIKTISKYFNTHSMWNVLDNESRAAKTLPNPPPSTCLDILLLAFFVHHLEDA